MDVIQTKNLLTAKEVRYFNSREFWEETPFYYMPNPTPGTSDKYLNYSSLSHVLINRWQEYGDSPSVNSDSVVLYKELFDRFCSVNGITYHNILRMAVNLTMHTPSRYLAAPHVDHVIDHSLCILYLSTSKGDTLFFSQKYVEGEVFNEQGIDDLIYKSSPEMGKMIKVDGKHYHTGQTCEEGNYRLVLIVTYN